jgi:hypothetical protein
MNRGFQKKVCDMTQFYKKVCDMTQFLGYFLAAVLSFYLMLIKTGCLFSTVSCFKMWSDCIFDRSNLLLGGTGGLAKTNAVKLSHYWSAKLALHLSIHRQSQLCTP